MDARILRTAYTENCDLVANPDTAKADVKAA